MTAQSPGTGPNPRPRDMWFPARACPLLARGRRPAPRRDATHTDPATCRPLLRGAAHGRRPGGHMERLAGQVAIVTGGGTGIGEATALALAREGARVALVGRRAEPLESLVAGLASEGHTAIAVPGDVTDPDAVVGFVGEVQERWGRVDVLVNSAGINVPQRDLASLSVADWDAVLRVNLTGTFLVTHA